MSAAKIRTRYSAEFLYPGSLFPESTSRAVSEPTFEAALAVAPDDTGGYFCRDGWYAVTIHATTEKRFVADDGEVDWVRQSTEKVGNWIVGEKIHYTNIPEDTDDGPGRNRILIANIKGNSTDGYGVKTRLGNWQIASDYTAVMSPAEVTA